MKIIGFSGKSGSGKDTAARFLESYLRTNNIVSHVRKTSFAAKLKDISYQLYKNHGLQQGEYYELHREHRLEKLPLGLCPVEIWIQVGNKLREVYPNTWVDFVVLNKSCDVLIITDVRKLNEAEHIKMEGGKVFLVQRDVKDLPFANSDGDLVGYPYDGVIENNGTLQELNLKVEDVWKQFG